MQMLKNIFLTFCILPILASVAVGENIRIGCIAALTGDAAAIGTEIVKVLEVAIDEANKNGGINGSRLELVVEDDGYEVSRSIAAYERIKGNINSKVIFMSTYGALFALGQRPERDGIVVVDTLDCNDALVKVSAMHSCVATRTESIAEGFLKGIESKGGGIIGVLYEEEAWFNYIVGSLRKLAQNRLVEVTVSSMAGDYGAEVLRLKAAGAKHIIFLGNDAMGKAMSQARAVGIDAFFYSIASASSPGFKKLAGSALEGVYISNWEIPQSERYLKFQGEFRSKNGREVLLGFVAGPTLDAGELVFRALGSIAGNEKMVAGAQLRQAMTTMAQFNGVCGLIKMDADGAVRTINERLFKYDQGVLRGSF